MVTINVSKYAYKSKQTERKLTVASTSIAILYNSGTLVYVSRHSIYMAVDLIIALFTMCNEALFIRYPIKILPQRASLPTGVGHCS